MIEMLYDSTLYKSTTDFDIINNNDKNKLIKMLTCTRKN